MATREETILIKAMQDVKSFQDLKRTFQEAGEALPKSIASEFTRVLTSMSLTEAAGATIGGTLATTAIVRGTEVAGGAVGRVAGGAIRAAGAALGPTGAAVAAPLAQGAEAVANFAVKKAVGETLGVGMEAVEATRQRIAGMAEQFAFAGISFTPGEIESARDILFPRELARVAAGAQVRRQLGGFDDFARGIWAGLMKRFDPGDSMVRLQGGTEYQ